MSNRNKIFLGVFSFLVIAGLVLFYFFNPKKAVSLILPDLSRITYINADIEKDSIRTKINVVVQNKSPYKLTIENIYFEIKLDDKLLARQTIPLNLNQLRHQVDTVELPIYASRKKFKEALIDLKGIDSTNLSAGFEIRYNTIFGRINLEYNKDIRIPVPVPPKIKIIKVEQRKYNFSEKILHTNIQLEIINKGRNIDLQLTNIHYLMRVENELKAQGIVNKTVSIRPGSTEAIEIPVDIEVGHPLKTIFNILTNNDQMNYELHIQADMIENMVGGIKQEPIPVEINASGKLELKK